MRAIRIARWGGPEVLELVEDAPMPQPAAHELLVRVSRAGVNFADTHARENSYLAAMTLHGGYAEYAAVPAATAFDIPDGVSDGAALALLI